MEIYLVLAGDVIGSKQLPPGYMAGLPARLDKFSSLEKEHLASPLALDRGDEVQGVLRDPQEAPALLRRLRHDLRPIRLRVGIGVGPLRPLPVPANPWAIEGEAVLRAREAMTELKETARHRFTLCRTGQKEDDLLLNTIWQLVDALQQDWSGGQWDAVQTAARAGITGVPGTPGLSSGDMAELLSIAGWPAVQDGEKQLSLLLAALSRKKP